MDAVVYVIAKHGDDFKSLTAALTRVGSSVRRDRCAESFLSRQNDAPGIAIIDQHLPDMDGIALMRQLLEQGATIGTVLASDTADTRVAVEAMRLGAHDVVERPFDVHRLADFVTRLNARQRHCRERIAADRKRAARIGLLSPREREVFDAVTDGLTSKRLAENLGLSPRTIEAHRGAIGKKLDTACVTDWVRIAVAFEHDGALGKPEATCEVERVDH